jgi:tRNA modification GTPase
MMSADPFDTIIALCTPPGPGGVALLRLSGPHSLRVARELLSLGDTLGRRPRRVVTCAVRGPDGGGLDSALAWFLPQSASYTGEDTVEISTHGSPAVVHAILEAARAQGVRDAEPGEFTRRAFLNGRLDLMQAEAVADLIEAEGGTGAQVAYGVLGGGLSEKLRAWRKELVGCLARIEALLDFGEDVGPEETSDLRARMFHVEHGSRQLVASFGAARARLRGFSVVLAGAPNVGKSTLLNALVGEDRAIVTPTPGTTRDWLEARVVWRGQNIRLVDTAGLREAADEVEQLGIERTREQLHGADVVLHLTEAGATATQTGSATFPGVPAEKVVAVVSKADQLTRKVTRELAVSALTGEGLEELRATVLDRLAGVEDHTGVPIRERHRQGLEELSDGMERAGQALEGGQLEVAAAEIQAGIGAAGGLLGEGITEEVLDEIFSAFCIGK